MREEPQRRSAKSYIFLGVHSDFSGCREKAEVGKRKRLH